MRAAAQKASRRFRLDRHRCVGNALPASSQALEAHSVKAANRAFKCQVSQVGCGLENSHAQHVRIWAFRRNSTARTCDSSMAAGPTCWAHGRPGAHQGTANCQPSIPHSAPRGR